MSDQEQTIRPEFAEIVSGWMLIDGMNDLTERIERAAEWTKQNGPLLPVEEITVKMMIIKSLRAALRNG